MPWLWPSADSLRGHHRVGGPAALQESRTEAGTVCVLPWACKCLPRGPFIRWRVRVCKTFSVAIKVLWGRRETWLRRAALAQETRGRGQTQPVGRCPGSWKKKKKENIGDWAHQLGQGCWPGPLTSGPSSAQGPGERDLSWRGTAKNRYWHLCGLVRSRVGLRPVL